MPRRRTRTVAIAVAAAVTGGAVAAADAALIAPTGDLVVNTTSPYRKFAGFTTRTANSLTRLVARFGPPTTIRRDGGNCVVRWRPLRLVTYISELGSVPGDPCVVGHVLSATVASTRWRTGQGVRVGDPVATARQACEARYTVPDCAPTGGRYPLQYQVTSCELNPGRFVVVYAKRDATGHVALIKMRNLPCE